MKTIMILLSISEVWNSLWMFVFSILILGYYCPHCHMSVIDLNVDGNVDPDVRPRTVQSPTSLASVNCTSKGSTKTKPIAVDGVITPSVSTTRYVVVFDIDWTLGHGQNTADRRRYSRDWLIQNHINASDDDGFPTHSNLTECPHIWFTGNDEPYLHIFLPHLRILFDYLMEHGVRIVFFSGGRKERNLSVIPELLRSFWGSRKYEALKSEGQFQIHSKWDMRWGNSSLGESHQVKDLRLIIQDGESVSNAVLVDDEYRFCAHGQDPLILVAMFNNIGHDAANNPLNNVYFLLGLFKTYFENEKYQTLPLKVAMAQILPSNYRDYYFCVKNTFVQEMVDLGFTAVRAEVPHATLY